jgi:phenol 2-monooxygenase
MNRARTARRLKSGRKYVVGCDGARSAVRMAIGRTNSPAIPRIQAWGVMDMLLDTDFPDIRMQDT